MFWDRVIVISTCIYIPAVSAEQKTPSGEPPRYAEDEGLYVGERPKVNWTNQVVVENRLLKRRDKVYWRNERDGQNVMFFISPLPGRWLVW